MPAGVWGDEPPSRFSLASLAYPGLAARACRLKNLVTGIQLWLLAWLVFTCLLSWHVALGQAIMTHLDALESAKAAITKREPDAAKMSAADKQEYATNEADTAAYLENLEGWLAPWKCLENLRTLCKAPGASGNATAEENKDRQWATVLLLVLATSVLPLFYGVLGAGAAVLRAYWNKVRESTLAPRDELLSLGQLGLGVVIGACIGLFVTPSGAAGQNSAAFTSAVSLTPSALSFIAGFGVEGVFAALESLINRVFNLPGQKAATPPSTA
jgi:hypothetical protein